jgi:hypothetical protein
MIMDGTDRKADSIDASAPIPLANRPSSVTTALAAIIRWDPSQRRGLSGGGHLSLSK